MILDQWRKKSVLYRTNAVLVPLGDDFRYTTQLEAELQYNNYQVRGTQSDWYTLWTWLVAWSFQASSSMLVPGNG